MMKNRKRNNKQNKKRERRVNKKRMKKNKRNKKNRSKRNNGFGNAKTNKFLILQCPTIGWKSD